MTGAPISIRLPETLIPRLQNFADANNMSVSEVVSEAMDAYTEGRVPFEDKKRTTARITVWADRERYAKFRQRTREEKVQVTYAIESAIEGML